MGLSVKEEWIKAYTRLLRDDAQPPDSLLTRDCATLEPDRPFSHLADKILQAFGDTQGQTGSRLRMSALRAKSESDLAFASALRELTSAGLIRVAPGFRLELTSRGCDAIARLRSRQ